MAKNNVSDNDLRGICETLDVKLRHLRAMLVMVVGEGRERLDSMSEEIRDDYLSSCETMACECSKLAQTVVDGVYKSSVAAANLSR